MAGLARREDVLEQLQQRSAATSVELVRRDAAAALVNLAFAESEPATPIACFDACE